MYRIVSYRIVFLFITYHGLPYHVIPVLQCRWMSRRQRCWWNTPVCLATMSVLITGHQHSVTLSAANSDTRQSIWIFAYIQPYTHTYANHTRGCNRLKKQN